MNINDGARQFLTKYAVAVLKRNPGLIINEIEKRFAAGLKSIKEEEFIKAFTENTDLLEFVNKDDAEYLRRLLATSEAREIYRTSLKPKITADLMIHWLGKHRPDLCSLAIYWKDDSARSYIKQQHGRGIKHIDDICEELEKVNQAWLDAVDIEEVEE
mgnify:CR=1 FL=1